MPENPSKSNSIFTRHPNLLLALILFILAVLLYSILPVHYPVYYSIIDDTIEYAIQAESSNPVDWFHPHHILNAALHRLLWLLVRFPGLDIRAYGIMSWTSRLSMALAVALLFILGRRMGASRKLAFALGLVFMVGCSPWTFGGISETVAPTTAIFLVLILLLFYRAGRQPPSLRMMFWLGLLFSFDICLHQMQVIYLPVLLLGMWGWERGQRLRRMGLFLLGTASLAGITYLLVILAVQGTINLKAGMDFATTYATESYWGKGDFDNIGDSLRTLVVTQSFSLYVWEKAFRGFWNIAASASAIFLGGVGLIGWFIPATRRNWRIESAWFFLFLLTAFFFITWWEAKCWDFWVLPWALILLGVSRIRIAKDWILFPLVCASIGFTAYYNFTFMVKDRTDFSSNIYYDAASKVAKLPANCREIMFTTNYHNYVYCRYFARVDKVILMGYDETVLSSNDRNTKITLRKAISDMNRGKIDCILLDRGAARRVGLGSVRRAIKDSEISIYRMG
jgi:hypothetical protein